MIQYEAVQNNLRLYNSLSRKIESFSSIKDNEVSMYVCGITPDAATHLGHAFTYITFDILIRLLKFQGYKVRYVQNVTDIDDDILNRSKAAGSDWKEFGHHWTSVFLTNMEKLGWVYPVPYVQASDAIPTIIKIVSELIEKGFAYDISGAVYFEVSKFKNYGKLSMFDRDAMIKLSRERGADPDDPNKRDPLDFILWQKMQKGEPFWESPWGKGRPGWHIECSSMIYDHLGEQIDIHGGGEDLIYPHHESEIAQSESFTGKKPFARFFLHTGSVGYKGEKMSKSLGNLILVSDLLKKYSPNAIRFLLLSNHYRKQWEYKEEEMGEAAKIMDEIEGSAKNSSDSRHINDNFLALLNSDLDTEGALKCLIEQKPKSLKACLKLLGFIF